jgi:arylsulfatase A-like enzyme/Flp pilus assembly protein TadD
MKLSRSGILLAVCLLLGCGRKAPPNVLLVTFDTTRADHMGYATGSRGVTPTLDALAASGTWFSECVATAPITLPSHTSILTGLYPYHHGVRDNGTYTVPREDVTLSRILHARGYATHAIVSAAVLDSRYGLNNGFDGYDSDLSTGDPNAPFLFREIKANRTADKAVQWLTSGRPADRPFFLWVHFYDPHTDYEPPPDVAARFPNDPYTGEIAFADRELGRVLDALRGTGEFDRTLIVFTADHGESLGAHGEATHTIFVYEATTRVPLLFHGPGVPAGRRVDGLTSVVDVFPTALKLLGVPLPTSGDGEDLSSFWTRGARRRDAVYMESLAPRLDHGWTELRAMRDEDYKAIEAPIPELYDLHKDPGEWRNLLSGRSPLPPAARALFSKLRTVTSSDPFNHGGQQPGAIDEEEKKKLAALGYLSSSPEDPGASRPDPKIALGRTNTALIDAGAEGKKKMVAGDFQGAVALFRRVLAQSPQDIESTLCLARSYAGLHDSENALAWYRRALAIEPASASAACGAGSILAARGQSREAERYFQIAVTSAPREVLGYVGMAKLMSSTGRPAEAENWLTKALQVDPQSKLAAAALARAFVRSGRRREALSMLEQAHEHDSSSHEVEALLGVLRAQDQEWEQAEDHLKKAVALDPADATSWDNLGVTLLRLGRRPEAGQCFEKSLALDPANAQAAVNLGSVALAGGDARRALALAQEALHRNSRLPTALALRAKAAAALGSRSAGR